MKRRVAVTIGAVLVAMLAVGAGSLAIAEQDDDDDDDPVLGSVVKSAPVTLEQGLSVSAKEGVPISGKFEIEVDGAQLSVYTAKDAAFSEVIVDHRTGRIEKVIRITDGKDLADAKKQMDAMSQADRSLEQVTVAALKSYKGYRAVSATPERKAGRIDGAPVVKVVLTDGKEWKTVYEPLVSEDK